MTQALANSATYQNITQLYDALVSNGYWNPSTKQLNLPAQNALGSAAISALLANSTFFPGANEVAPGTLAISGASAATTQTIVFSGGTLNTNFLHSPTPATQAIFWLDDSFTAQLTIVPVLGDAYSLATAFDALNASPTVADQNFDDTSYNLASRSKTNPALYQLSFSGTPVLNEFVSGLWPNGCGVVTGDISVPASNDAFPLFTLQSKKTSAPFTIGLLTPPLVYLQLSSTSSAASITVEGTIQVSKEWPDIALSMPLPTNAFPNPVFGNQDIGQKINNLSQLSAIFFGQALANLIPPRFPLGDKLSFSTLAMSLGDNCGTAISQTLSISLETNSLSLLPADLATLEKIEVSFSAFSSAASPISVIFNGTFKLGGKNGLDFIAGFALPDCVTTASNIKPIDVGLMLGAFVPGLAPPRGSLVVPELSARLSPITQLYNFQGNVQINDGLWSIDFGRGVPVLALEQVGFVATRSATSLALEFNAQMIFLGSRFYLLASRPADQQNWQFSGQLAAETPLTLKNVAAALLPFIPNDSVPDISITALSGDFNTGLNTYRVAASLLWKLDFLSTTIQADFLLASERASKTETAVFSGFVKGLIDINNLVLTVAYIFSPTTTDFTFAYKSLSVTYHSEKVDPFVAISLKAGTIGDLIAFLMSFADPKNSFKLSSPWDALEKISLPNLTVKVHLKTKEIEVELDMQADLVFITISKFTLSYTRKYGKAKLNIGLFGNFLGQDYTEAPLGWDLLNEPAPAVPGAGTQSFDLEYLGLGQRITLRGPMPATMDAVILALENALTPTGNPNENPTTQLPGMMYDAGSNFLLGTRFTVASTCQLSVVFNDPNLYGLLIQLSGSKAGSLAGLRFEILYRKISDGLGVYHIELTLPDAMRNLQFGAVSITLPIVTIDIYTNGNFRVDVGFPPSLTDFSRSASVQVFPFLGYGGFYFAVLNGQTSTQVPTVSNGSFSPVLEFGFALQVGVGKTISLGILSGGISVTVGGMLQGVLAWFNPNQQNLPSTQFFKLKGTVAIIGKVYATVNFGIIQANVSLEVFASVSIDMESYKSTLIEVSAGVRVKLSIKILFIRLHFSFSATIYESFRVGSDSTPPWLVSSSSSSANGVQSMNRLSNARRANNAARLSSDGPEIGLRNANRAALASQPATHLPKRGSYRTNSGVIRPRPYALLRSRAARQLNLGAATRQHRQISCLASFGNARASVQLDVTVIPLISQALAADYNFPGGPSTNGNAATSAPNLTVLLAMPTSLDPSNPLNQLQALFFDWAIGAVGHEHESISAAVVSEVLEVLKGDAALDTYFTYDSLSALFAQWQVVFNLVARPTSSDGDSLNEMALLAMFPAISMQTPSYSINFLTDRIPQNDYEAQVKAYFAALSAQFAEREAAAPKAGAGVDVNESLATFIFRNYFLMLTRGALQGAQDVLNQTTCTVSATDASLTSLANSFNNNYTVRQGDTLTSIAAMFQLPAAEIAAANPGLDPANLEVGLCVFIPAQQVHYLSQHGDTGSTLASCFGLSLAELQAANPQVDFNNLAINTNLLIPALRVLQTSVAGETGQDIALEFGVTVDALQAANPSVNFNPLAANTPLLIPLAVDALSLAIANQNSTTILRSGAQIDLGEIDYFAGTSDGLSSIATAFGVPQLSIMNANSESLSLLAAGQEIALGTLSTTTRAKDSLNGLALYWKLDLDALSNANTGLLLVVGQVIIVPLPTGNINYSVVAGNTVNTLLTSWSAQEVSIADIAYNNTILLTSGQTVQLPNVSHLTSLSYFLPYTTTTGDSLQSIALAYFANTPEAQQSAIQALLQWNTALTAEQTLDAGTVVQIPYASSLANLCRQYALSMETLASNATLGASSSLAALAALLIPSVQHTVQTDESLSGIAQAYSLSIEELADRIALTTNLFTLGELSAPPLAALKEEKLLQLIASSGGFTNAANMSTRFMLNGLRLPAPQLANLPAPSSSTAYPLYALIGQSYPLPTNVGAGYAINLTPQAGVTWLTTASGTLAMPLTPEELTRVQDFGTLRFNPNVVANSLIALPQYAYAADQQPVPQLQQWHTADLPDGLTPAGQKAGQPSIWMLPAALQQAVANSPRGFLPYQAAVITKNSDGSSQSQILPTTRWATKIDFSIQQLPNDIPGAYLMLGADQDGMQRLLAVWSEIVANQSATQLYLAYPEQSQNSGEVGNAVLVTDLLNRNSSFLLKTNLSTESHGSSELMLARTANTADAPRLSSAPESSPIASLSIADSARFLELLWECSVVKSGGYTLRYALADGKLGLPATLFESSRQATLSLIIVQATQTTGLPLVYSYNNAILVGDNPDSGSDTLSLQAVAHTIASGDTLQSIAAAYPYLALDAAQLAVCNQNILGQLQAGSQIQGYTIGANDTFATVAAALHIGIAALGTAIANTADLLKRNGLLQLEAEPVQMIVAGDTLSSIASQYLNLDVAALTSLNANTPSMLASGKSLQIPGQANYTIANGDTFASIALSQKVSVPLLGESNAESAIFTAGSNIVVAGNTLRIQANMPPGHVGFSLLRNNPQPTDLANETSQQALNALFNLLGFSIQGNSYFNTSNMGLPAGPTNDEGDVWNYNQLLSITSFAQENDAIDCPALPPKADNPYAGIAAGSHVDLALGFQDILGDDTSNSSLGILRPSVGYTDELVALAAWPAVTKKYRFIGLPQANNFQVALSLSTDRYAADNTPGSAAAQHAAQDAASYATILYQLEQTDASCYLTCSLGSIADAVTTGKLARLMLLGAASSAYIFLNQASAMTPVLASTGGAGGSSYATLAQLIAPNAQPAGYPTNWEDLASSNTDARADLLFGLGSALSLPLNVLAKGGETSLTIADEVGLDISTLANNNAEVNVADGVAVRSALRYYSVPNDFPLCLQALAANMQAPLQDSVGGVLGVISSNASVILSEGITFLYEASSYTTQKDDSLQSVATALSTDLATALSVTDVAMANLYLNGIYPIGTQLSANSGLTISDETLTELSKRLAPPANSDGTSLVAQMLSANQNVPGLWPIGGTLFIRNTSYTVQQGDTLSSIANTFSCNIATLLGQNANLKLAAYQLQIPWLGELANSSWASYQASASDTFANIATRYTSWDVSQLAQLNQGIAGLFNGTPITLGAVTKTPTLDDTFASLALAFNLTVSAFAQQIANLPNLIRAGAVLITIGLDSKAQNGANEPSSASTLQSLGKRFGVSPAQLASANASLLGLIPSGQQLSIDGRTYTTYPNDAYALLTARINLDRLTLNLAPMSVGQVGTVTQEMPLLARNLLAPTQNLSLAALVTPSYSAAISQLLVSLAISRDPSHVSPEFSYAPNVLSVQTTIPPASEAGQNNDSTQSLTQFATDFEATFSGLKLGTGPSQIQGKTNVAKASQLSSSSSSSKNGNDKGLWVVNFSGQGQSMQFSVQGEQARFFSLPPLTTEAWNGEKVPVPSYDSASGLTWPEGQTQNFQAEDPDLWQQSFLNAIDLLLSPQYAVQGYSDATVAANITAVLNAKGSLAQSISNTLQSILVASDEGLSAAQQALYQQMLVKLETAYQVQTLLQVPLKVSGAGASASSSGAPQLSGKLNASTIITAHDGAPSKDGSAQPLQALALQCAVNAVYLANIIADLPQVIRPNVTVIYREQNYLTLSSDTLSSIATHFASSVSDLARSMQIGANDISLFLANTAINVTSTTAPSKLTKVTDVANWQVVTVTDVLQANADRTDFFTANSTITVAQTSVVANGQSLQQIADVFGGVELFGEKLSQVDVGGLDGRYTLNPIAPPHGLQLIPQLSFTTAKAALTTDTSTPSQLTSLISFKDPSAYKSTTLQLSYGINQLEFDVHQVDGITGYQSSSWISFILPLQQTAFASSTLGQVQIPIPLRGYPSATVISAQNADSGWPGDAEDIATQWNYSVSLQQQMAAQDQLTLKMRMNIQSDGASSGQSTSLSPVIAAVIRALAAFTTVWPQISHDLNALADENNGVISPATKNAVAALAELVLNVQNAWLTKMSLAVADNIEAAFTYTLSTLTSGSPPYFSSLLLDHDFQGAGPTSQADDFLFLANSDAASISKLNEGTIPANLATVFANFGFPLSADALVKVNQSGKDWAMNDNAAQQTPSDGDGQEFNAPQTYRVLLQSGQASTLVVYRQLLWPAIRLSGKEDWQNAQQSGNRLVFNLDNNRIEVGQPIQMTLDFYRLNILMLQNARGGSFVNRNANLISGAQVNPAFVYTTPINLFPNKISPFIKNTDAIELEGSNLQQALASFFTQLFAAQASAQPNSTRDMRIDARYWQAVDGISAPNTTPLNFQVPLLLLPRYAFNVTSDTASGAGSFIDQLASTIVANADAAGIAAATNGKYLLDITLYSTIKGGSQYASPQPLVELSQLMYPRSA